MTRHLIAATLAGILAATAAGCATAPQVHYALVPVKSNGTDLPGLDSKTILESRQPGSIVSVRGDDRFAAFGAGFIVAVHNKGATPVEFGPKNIQVSVNGVSIPVMGANELDEKVQADIRSYVRATSRTGQVDVEQATPSAERDYRFNNFGGNPAGQGGNSGCALAEDGCRNYRVDRENRQRDAELVAEAATALQQNQTLIAERALRASTVAPEAMAGGAMVVQPPKNGGAVDITVTFNGQTHRFTFSATPTA